MSGAKKSRSEFLGAPPVAVKRKRHVAESDEDEADDDGDEWGGDERDGCGGVTGSYMFCWTSRRPSQLQN